MNQLDMEQLYAKLGKAYYEGKFEDPLPELLPLFDQITRAKTEMERQEKMRANVCPGCNMPVEPNAVFCGNCGTRIRG